ncbi:alpha/beta fold hydrolase [Saccharophagus degradans]|uniref:Alpha/beta fold hydrolase n=1 Tax=Saccharophagus degradans TaxID=86304 RepID=A0AAW7X5Q7_9GAMM|nr:alpha/beta fold hydrolase [Saccharophagus degradans]MDO6422182.1 alpha/beta fold hydrolase [Saccharophagus degradans]MDO6607543.1 alpha/beta fold hydrolase [Saccharophagus degradans]
MKSKVFSLLILGLLGWLNVADGYADEVQQLSTPASIEGRINKEFKAGNLAGLHSSIFWHRGKIISTNHFAGEDRTFGRPLGKVEHSATTLHDLRSVTKSIVALLYGIALEEGVVPVVKYSLVDSFPEYVEFSNDQQRRRISIHDTLSMQMGLEWNEDLPYTDPRNSETAMELSKDRIQFALGQPIIEPPGQRWVYGGGSTELIAKLIEKNTGKSLSEYAKEKLFKPLGISKFEWITANDGREVAASGLRLSAMDLLKIGKLILDDGLHKNKQIISKQWLGQAFTPHSETPYDGIHYGYFWYVSSKSTPSQWVAGFGNGGQRLLIDKKNQLIQVVLAGNYNQRDAWKIPAKLLDDIVLPALQAKAMKDDVALHYSCRGDGSKHTEINVAEYALIGGVKQWVTIKGKNCSNPIVLMVHGGPGNPLSLYHDSLYQDFEKHFTIVHWDQRGSGRTYRAQFETGKLTMEKITNQNLSIELLVKDGVEVSDYIRNKLGQDKLIISGSSWGAFLATKIVHSAPNRFHFYVGLSQLVNGHKTYTASYNKVKALATEKNDLATLDTLNRIGPPKWSNPASYGKLRRIISRYEREAAGKVVQWQVAKEYLAEVSNPEYIFAEEFSFLRYIGLNDDGMIENISLDDCCTHLKVPIYMIQGQKDLLTVPEVTKKYFDEITAPEKKYIGIENSGHDPSIEMVKVHLDTLKLGAKKYIHTRGGHN